MDEEAVVREETMSTDDPPPFPLPRLQAPDFDYHTDSIRSGKSTLEKNQEQVWQELTRFYAENEQTLEKAITLDITAIAHPTELSTAIDSFTETVKVVLDGLVVLGNVHPVLGIAIFAFHSVISLDLTRRENNKKIIAVKLQMQNMMCALFQLRKLKHTHVESAEREAQRSELQRLVKSIAQDITACGSDLNYYKDRQLLSKLIKAKIYEKRFAEHIETFTQRRAELQSIIGAYTAAGIDAANIAIAEVGHKLSIMDNKLDNITHAIFRKLEPRREKDALSFIEANGGANRCINDDELLSQLLSMTEETSREKTGPYIRSQLRESLIIELNENLEDVLAKNYTRFEKLLAVQNNNLQRISDQIEEHGIKMYDHSTKLDVLLSTSISILEEGKVIRRAVLPNSTVKLKDPELQQIWDRMGLKRSVKAKTFVLTFRDHLLGDRSVANTPYSAALPELRADTSSTLLSPITTEKPTEITSNVERDEDSWVLKYIDVPYVRPIVEAMDEDGSGFISVKEANKFALSRPAGWKLLDWIAYWAAGWHTNITRYRTKIYSTLCQILQACNSVLPANRVFAAYYYNCFAMTKTEGLLHSISPLPDNAPVDSKLSEIAQAMADLQEKRLLTNLQEMSYIIKSASDVTLIAGSSRIETWILPLLHLVLEHHLKVVKLAERVVLHHDELSTQVNSISSIFSVFEERLSHLEAIFRQMYRDVEVQFKSHAYGMFLAAFKGKYPSTENILPSFIEEKDDQKMLKSDLSQKSAPDISILSQGIGPAFEFMPAETVPLPPNHTRHALEGAWVGMCGDPAQPHHGFFAITIGPIIEDRFTGQGDTWFHKVAYYGAVEMDESVSPQSLTVFLRILYPSVSLGDHLLCRGLYDPEREIIEGVWTSVEKSPDNEAQNAFPFTSDLDEKEKYRNIFDEIQAIRESSEGKSARFYMTRRDTFRFRHLLGDSSPLSSWTLARKRWAFATESVLFETRRRMGSSTYWRERVDDCRRYIELSFREYLHSNRRISTRGYLTEEDKDEYERLKTSIHPSIARLIEEFALYIYKRCIYDLGDYYCDVCDQQVRVVRLVCITCIEDDLSNQIDMCAECINSPVFNRENKYVHHPSHTLIRFVRHFYDCLASDIISQARLRSEKIKASFKAGENNSTLLRNVDRKYSKPSDIDKLVRSRPSLTPLVCACCGKGLALPCWACLDCEADLLICLDCQRTSKPVPKTVGGVLSKHLHHHALLRINHVDEVKTSEIQLIRLESNTVNISNGLAELEQKLSTQYEEMQERLNKLETKVDTQLGLMTSLLQELVVATRSKKAGDE